MEKQFFTVWLVLSSQIILADPAVHKNDIDIYSLHVDSKVTSRFAHTVITSRVVNRANESKEALFEVELPKTAFITNFSMTIDGETYPGIIKEKKSAQDQYDTAVARGQSAGLVKSTGRKLEQFHVSVNVAAASKVTFELIYEELLKRKLGKYELLIKVKPKQLVNRFQIDVHIFEPQGISFLETDSTFMTNELSNALTKVQEETKAHISFKPTVTQQRKSPELEDTLLDGDFLIRYDVRRSVTAGDIQIINGYFVHYFAPPQMPVFPKNIIFVIDKSGSMNGKKIQQTKEAMQKNLEDLNPEDHFNFIVFSRDVSEWKPTLLQATEENVELAKQYVRTIRAQGATNINDALLKAIYALDNATSAELLPDQSISMIVLLTDGQPTTGVTMVKEIQKNIEKANKGKYFLYCLGFGFDVSYAFLEKMALENGGVARRIYEDSDAALQLQGFYQEVATPILKEIEMKYPDNTVLELTQNNFALLFDGSEIVVAGKIRNGIDVFPVEIKAQTQTSVLTLKEDANITEKEQVFEHQKYVFGNFMERLWAYLTIQQLLEKAVSAKGVEQKSLEAQTLALSLKFSFVTPLTSMVVTKPDAEEVANKPTEADNENFRSHGGVAGRRILGSQGSSSGSPSRHSLKSSRFSRLRSENFGSGMPMLASKGDGLRDFVPIGSSVSGMPMLASKGEGLRDFVPTGSSISGDSVSFDIAPGNGRFHSSTVNDFPHVIFQLSPRKDPICLTISGPLHTPINLLSDPHKGIQITGKLGENKKFAEFAIFYQNPKVNVSVSRGEITVHDMDRTFVIPWTAAISSRVEGLMIAVEELRRLSLSGPGNIIINILHVHIPVHFLGLHFENSDTFSEKVTGSLGQFYFNTHFESSPSPSRSLTTALIVQGQRHLATRQIRKDYRTESGSVVCWSLHIPS